MSTPPDIHGQPRRPSRQDGSHLLCTRFDRLGEHTGPSPAQSRQPREERGRKSGEAMRQDLARQNEFLVGRECNVARFRTLGQGF